MNRTIINTRTDSTFNGNPFVGLRPFNSDEGLLFFGRQDQAAELMRKLHLTRFLGVVGSSGCGKSSLIRAGLIPKLKAGLLVGDRDRWWIAIMKPGDAPLRNLAISLIDAGADVLNPATTALLEKPAIEEIDVAAMVKSLRRAGAQAAIDYLAKNISGSSPNLLLLVDQFEELFHFGVETGDPKKRDEAADFVSIVLDLAEQRALPIYVVITMRSDYLGECDNFYGLPEALNRSQYLVPRLTRQQRQQAIEGPIRLFGQKITPRLVDRVLNEVGDQSDQLPVMQHVLMRTWDNWRQSGGEVIDSPHYEEAGTIKRALSDDADSALIGMTDEERKITERMFQALTNVDTRNRRVRRQTHLSELLAITGATREQLLKVINRFRGEGRSFLNIEDDKLADDPLVDISHESLIRQWKQLDKWLNDESDWRDIYVRLADDAERYKKGRVDLWRDPQLQIALNWYADRKPNKAWAERYHPGFDAAIEFMEKSRAEREAEAEREEARRKKELADAMEREEARRKQLRRNKIVSIILSLSLLSSLMAGGYALKLKAQTDSANDNLKKSNTALDEARKNEEEKNERLEGYVKRNSELVTNLESQKRDLEAAKFSVTKALNAAERSAANATLSAFVANEQATEARKQSRISSQHLAQLLGLHSVHLAPEGANDGEAIEKRALLAAQALRIKTDNGEPLPTVEGDRAAREILALAPRVLKSRQIGEYGGGASFSQNADTVIALTSTKDVRLIDPFTGRIKSGLENLRGGADQIALSADGKYVAVLQTDSPPSDTANRSAGAGQPAGVVGLPLVTRGFARIQVFETATGRPFGQPIVTGAPTNAILKTLLSPDGSRLVTLTNVSLTSTVAQLWETATGKAVGSQRPDPPVETTEQQRRPNPSQKSQNLSRSLIQNLPTSWSSKVIAAAFSPDGKTLATIHTNDQSYSRTAPQTIGASRLYFWNTETGERAAAPIEADAEKKSFFNSIAYSPDGKYMLTIRRGLSSPAFIELWNSQTGKLVAEPLDKLNGKWAVFDRSGNEVAVVTDANTVVKLTIINDGGRIKLESGKPIYYGSEPQAVAFSDDGAHLIVVSNEGEITISETKAAPVVENIPAAEDAVMTFTPNGRLHATDDGRKVKTWDSLTGKLYEFPLSNADNPIEPLALAFSNGGRFLATVSDVIRIWDGVRSEQINRSIKTPDRIKLAAFSPTGDFLAMAGDNGAAVGEEMRDATSRLKLPDISAATTVIAVSEDARREERSVRYLATTDGGGEARIRELIKDKNGVYKAGAVVRVNPGTEIASMTFLEREQLLATASGGLVKIWDSKTGNQIGEPLRHSSRVNDLSVHLGRPFLAVACQDGKIVVWEIKRDHSWSQEQTLEFTEPVEKVSFSPAGPHLAAAGAGKAQVWHIAGWRKYEAEINVGKAGALTAPLVAHGAGGNYLWVAGEDGTCRIRRFEPGQPLSSSFRCAGPNDKVFFSPNGRRLVTGSVSFPRVWDLIYRSLDGRWVPAVALSPDGRYLASSYGRAIRVHSASDLRELYSRVIEGEITLLAFNPAGDLMIVSRKKGETDNAIAATGESEDVWNIETRNAETGDLIGKTPGLKEGITALAFSPAEDVFATVSSDLNDKPGIVLWKNTAPEIKRAEGKPIYHGSSIKELAFSPDGKFIAATGAEGAHIWEVATRQEVAEIPEARNSPAFSPDGKYLAVTSKDGIKVLHWRPDDLAEDVCARLRRNFTYDEWQQYLKEERSYERTCREWEVHQTVIDEAINLAKAGKRAEAEALFKAMRDLKNSPEEEAEWHETALRSLDQINAKMFWRVWEEGKRKQYLGAGENEAEIKSRLREAIPLLDDFKKFYQRPHSFNPNRVSGAKNRQARLEPARILNGLCWYGSLFGYVDRVKDACQIAVEFDPKFTDITDSRGLVRALTGDYKGAIADFEIFSKTGEDLHERAQRRQWAEALRKCLEDQKSCQFPFTEEGLKKIRGQ